MSLNIAGTLVRKLKTVREVTLIGLNFLYTGQYTLWEFMLSYVNYVIATFTHKDLLLHLKAKVKRMKKKYLRDGVYVFKDGIYVLKEVRLPALDPVNEIAFFNAVIVDTFLVYMKYDDCYDEEKINALYECLPEGPYGLRNQQVDVTLDYAGGGV
ncbi:MAG: hypothetical protein LBO82_06295, partial [Synergistaceae bacterium]|nr:hypothetical protein [Synergistaceae bacterium]